ncbi:MAG: hypothetical protein GY785_11605 [Gammaproteobacteria bacterium]|nr:hypothetical protein [Gammaproteobacteria bacterium]
MVAIEPIADGVQSYRVSHQGHRFPGEYQGLPSVMELVSRHRSADTAGVSKKATIYHRIAPECPVGDLPDENLLVKLGDAMKPPNRLKLPARPDAIGVPAAYTYFGQLIAHDLNDLNVVSGGSAMQLSNSKLDLSSLFWHELDETLLEADSYVEAGVAIGRAVRKEGYSYNDLPRNRKGRPLIPDQRNDVNLAIAQLCVAISKFHHLLARKNPWLDPESVRKLTVRQIQAITLFDFLPRILDPQVYRDVMTRGRGLLPEALESFRVPIEFSSACYRFGHSLVRDRYRWNAIETEASTQDLLDRTHLGGDVTEATGGRQSARWIADWKNLLPMKVVTENVHDNASAIDMRMAYTLFKLDKRWIKNPYTPRQFVNLASQTLLRSRDYRLADAQTTIDHINRQLEPGHVGIVALCESEIKNVTDESVRDAVVNSGFHESTPLWFYVLREASIFHAGQKLGPMGSRIVMETIHAAIEASDSGMIVANRLVVSETKANQMSLVELIKKTQFWTPVV